MAPQGFLDHIKQKYGNGSYDDQYGGANGSDGSGGVSQSAIGSRQSAVILSLPTADCRLCLL